MSTTTDQSVGVSSLDKIIHDHYYNITIGLQSATALYRKLKPLHPQVTLAQIKEFVKHQETHQIHSIQKTPLSKFNQIRALGLGNLEIDLLDLSLYKGFNNQRRYILMVADTYSRKLWTRPLLKKTGEQVLTAMKSIESEMQAGPVQRASMKPIIIESIIADRGTEFGNNQFKTHFKHTKIFYKDPEIFNSSLAIVDRMCLTLRNLLNRYFTAYKTKKYIDVLQKLTDNINNTINSTIKHTPNDIWNGKAINEQTIREVETLKVGDRVRIRNSSGIFNKKHTSNFSTDIYTVDRIDGLGYRLDGKRRKYFISELLKI